MQAGIEIVERCVRAFDRQTPAVRHGIARVERKIQQRRLELNRIEFGKPEPATAHEFDIDVFRYRSSERTVHGAEQRVDVDPPGFERLPARKREQAPRQLRAARSRGGRHLGEHAQLLLVGQLFAQDLRIAEDDGKQVVEVMGDTTGQLADRLEPLRLLEPLVELSSR